LHGAGGARSGSLSIQVLGEKLSLAVFQFFNLTAFQGRAPPPVRD